MGETVEDAVDRAKEETKGYVYSYDMLGEGARICATLSVTTMLT